MFQVSAFLLDANFWFLVTLVVFLGIFLPMVWRVVQQYLDDRKQDIQENIDHAEKNYEEARTSLEKARLKYEKISERTEEILKQAHLDAERINVAARTELDRRLKAEDERTQQRILQIETKTLGDLKEQAIQFSLEATQKVIKKTLTEADRQALIEEALQEIKER